MGAYNTKTILGADPQLIPAIAERISQIFAADGYEVKQDNLLNGGIDISVTKGGIFKAVLGLKTALKITLSPEGNRILFDAGIGIFGRQIIPTIISMFFAWPVLITQIWGSVEQSKLDDRALAAANDVIREHQMGGYGTPTPPPFGTRQGNSRFCTNCGNPIPANSKFCPNCGTPLS
ncbi:MAG: zinc-ribbon domain-containing protein [Muribaculaceae bacterium]|nr:zinc-ribbon domain-containing protein [Muribaculaceae bacterium]